MAKNSLTIVMNLVHACAARVVLGRRGRSTMKGKGEMKIDKRVLLVSMAMAVAMFAAVSTSSATAAVWKDKGVNVTKLITIELTGGEVFESGTSGMSCELAVTMTTEGGST